MEVKVIDKIAGEIIEGEKNAVLEEAVERVFEYKESHPDIVLATGEEENTLYIKNS